jgi:LysM repeat protein
MRRIWLFLLVVLIGAFSVSAQNSERLINPGLEEGSFGPYTTRRGGEFAIYLPNSWNSWFAPQSGDFFNRGDRTTINPHPGPGPSPKEGSRALSIDCGFVTCTAAIYQQIAVQPNTNIQASAWAQVKACNPAANQTSCGSAVESGSQTRIGIDPNGGTDPNDGDIVWSGFVQPHDQWLEMRVSATTTGTTATLFLYSTQLSTASINKTYWDQTSLTGGGIGGAGATAVVATPTPTPLPSVPFVVPQGARPDGSIVHVVGSGDTVDSIAVAYGTTRTEIMALNNLSDPRIIRVGQELLVREAAPTDEPAEPTVTPQEVAQNPTPIPPGSDSRALALIPLFTNPEGVTIRENTGLEGSSDANGQAIGIVSSIIASNQTPEAILASFRDQLTTAGWLQVSGNAGDGFAWGIWRIEDANGTVWGLTLTLTASPINVGQYTFLMQVEEGPSVG